MLFWLIFGNFWCPVVTLVTFSRNISNFERNRKITKKNPKEIKNLKIKKNFKIKKKNLEKIKEKTQKIYKPIQKSPKNP